jgi:hypothetical protein
MMRPKTGFKQKSDDDLIKANYDLFEKYVDMLYEDDENQSKEQVKGARLLLFLLADPENIYNIVLEKESQLNAIARTMKDEHKKKMELLIHLLAFFYTFSHYSEFHNMLSSLSIGETCINIIDFQYAKYIIRKNDIISKQKTLSGPSFQKELDKFLFLVRKQDRILRYAFTVLMHLAEDPNIEKKMVKKDIVGVLVKNMNRNNINLIVVMLLFIKKLSIMDINKDSMIKYNILDELMKYYFYII